MMKLKFETKMPESVWSDETVEKIETLLQRKYQAFLENEFFEIEVGANKFQVQLRTTLVGKDGKVTYPVESVHMLDLTSEDAPSAEEVAELMLDYLDVYWNEYLTGGRETFVPLDWSKYTCEGVDFYMRGFVREVGLEKQADELFKLHGSGQYDIEPIGSES